MKQILALKFILIALVFISVFSSLISAFGVSSPYWEGSPLTMAAGETKTINLNLQNMVGNENVTVKAEIKNGSDIASLEKDTYTVILGTSDTMVPLEIKIPKNASGTRKIEVEFKTVTLGAGGGVAMGTGMKTSFDVVISGKATQEISKTTLAGIVIAIAIIIIIILVVLKRKKTR